MSSSSQTKLKNLTLKMDNTKGKVKSFIEIKEEHATGYPHKNFKFVSVSTSCNFAEFDLKKMDNTKVKVMKWYLGLIMYLIKQTSLYLIFLVHQGQLYINFVHKVFNITVSISMLHSSPIYNNHFQYSSRAFFIQCKI